MKKPTKKPRLVSKRTWRMEKAALIAEAKELGLKVSE